MDMKGKVMMVGSAEQSGGGVSSVIKLMKKMPMWEEYSCYWLGTQIQRNYLWKLWYAVKAAVIAPFIMWRYDIVHFHTVPDKIGLLIQLPELLLAKIYGKKIIIEVHVGNQLSDHIDNRLFKWCLNKADIIALLANRWKMLFEEKYSDVKTPVEVIYNACSNIKSIPYSGHKKTIVMVGDLRINKSCNTLIDAFAKIYGDYPDWEVILLGRGNQEEILKKQAESLGIADKIKFPGYVTGDVFFELFGKAGIYCMCSKVEGFPMAVLEAWSYGVPVVTTPVGGLPDVMEEGKNCISFLHGDSDKLANHLRYLIDNPGKCYEMSEYSKRFVHENFSLNKISREIDLLYQKILNNA